jgi:hypothetical protein
MDPRTIPVAGASLAEGALADRALVSTSMIFEATPDQVWERLMFYEQIDERPPIPLRLLLPVPIRTVGRKSEVGDEARCLYEGGHLVKRVTRIERGRHYGFEVVEQALDLGGGMTLSGGAYDLREIAPGRVEVTVTTRYASPKRPRWLWEPIEGAVCHAFHRHILRAMRRGAGSAEEAA